MLNVLQITQLHDQATLRWHQDEPWPDHSSASTPVTLIELALAHHRTNFDLWHEEDKVREPEAPDAVVGAIKHAIDALNQTRNDLVEALDRALLVAAGAQDPAAPLHSESPAEESRRASASEAHRQNNLARLALLEEQRSDLAACLNTLWTEVLAGQRRFKLYRQMKMYNDPDLNPLVYAHKAAAKPG